MNAADSTVADRLDAIGNRVVYHSVTMPAKVEGVSIQGGASQVVRGMPFSLKVTPALTSDRVTVAVNGINKVVDAAIANLSIAAVTEDLDITIQVNPAGANAYTVVNVREGELASKLEQCPSRLKITGVMRSEDFEAIRRNASKIVDLDLADVVVKGVRDLNNAIPSNAFAAPEPTTKTALAKVTTPVESRQHRRECLQSLRRPEGNHSPGFRGIRRRECFFNMRQPEKDNRSRNEASIYRIDEPLPGQCLRNHAGDT